MEEVFVSLAELKVILDKEKAARSELNPEQQYALSHASLFARVLADKVPPIMKELMEIPMMSPFNAVKIVDLMPTHMDDVRAIFAKEGFALSIGQRVYIGKEVDQRAEVLHVKRRVGHEELTTAAQKELPFVIQETVKEKEAKFVDFFNRAQAITTRFHMLELRPGLGKKTMWAILEERKKGPFKSFQDLDQRVPSVHHPEKLIAKRIEMEISDPTQKYRLFVAR